MRFSFDLLDRGLFVRPHKGLSSDSCWSFFMGYSPVQQSLQEYLGVLVGNPMEPWRWVPSTSSMGLKGVLDWIFNRIIPRGIIQRETSRECIYSNFNLNLICGGVLKTHLTHHREKHIFRGFASGIPMTLPIRETLLKSVWNQRVGWVIRYPFHSHHWGLPNPYEFFFYLNYGHDMKPIGWWSYRVRVKSFLVLLEMFSHPIQLWCSRIPIRIVI